MKPIFTYLLLASFLLAATVSYAGPDEFERNDPVMSEQDSLNKEINLSRKKILNYENELEFYTRQKKNQES